MQSTTDWCTRTSSHGCRHQQQISCSYDHHPYFGYLRPCCSTIPGPPLFFVNRPNCQFRPRKCTARSMRLTLKQPTCDDHRNCMLPMLPQGAYGCLRVPQGAYAASGDLGRYDTHFCQVWDDPRGTRGALGYLPVVWGKVSRSPKKWPQFAHKHPFSPPKKISWFQSFSNHRVMHFDS